MHAGWLLCLLLSGAASSSGFESKFSNLKIIKRKRIKRSKAGRAGFLHLISSLNHHELCNIDINQLVSGEVLLFHHWRHLDSKRCAKLLRTAKLKHFAKLPNIKHFRIWRNGCGGFCQQSLFSSHNSPCNILSNPPSFLPSLSFPFHPFPPLFSVILHFIRLSHTQLMAPEYI